MYKDSKETRVQFAQFQQNLRALFDQSREYKAKVIFIGPTLVDEALVNPIPWTPEKSYLNSSIKRFSAEINAFCAKHNLPFLNIFEEWIKLDYKKFLIDGLHPTTQGHEILYKTIKLFLEQEKVIQLSQVLLGFCII